MSDGMPSIDSFNTPTIESQVATPPATKIHKEQEIEIEAKLTGCTPIEWLDVMFVRNPSLGTNRESLYQLKWALQQLDAEKAVEFEAQARAFSFSTSKRHPVLEKIILEIPTVLERFEASKGHLDEKLGTAEMSALNRIMELERTREVLMDSIDLVRDEASWRNMIDSMAEGLDRTDLDQAQQSFEKLKAFAQASPHRQPQRQAAIQVLQQQLIHKIRNS